MSEKSKLTHRGPTYSTLGSCIHLQVTQQRVAQISPGIKCSQGDLATARLLDCAPLLVSPRLTLGGSQFLEDSHCQDAFG